MNKIVTALPIILLCVCVASCSSRNSTAASTGSPPASSSSANCLVGTWTSDHQQTISSIRQGSGLQDISSEDIERVIGPGGTWTFARDWVQVDTFGRHFDYPYTVVSSDDHVTAISLGDPGATKLDTFQFEDDDTVWVADQNAIPDVPIHDFRQYYRRMR